MAIDEPRKLTWVTRRQHLYGEDFRSAAAGGRRRGEALQGQYGRDRGAEGAQVISIYEGKVVEVKRNRITNKYDVYIAHGEYISSYANLNSVTVGKDDKVARNQQIGTIGSGSM